MTEQEGSKAEILTPQDIAQEKYETYKKTGLTRARKLTQADYALTGGNIQTLEGPASFKPGDYLAIGVKGEKYPIRAETMANTKVIVGEPNHEGWADYETTTTVKAAQIDRAFGVKRQGTDETIYGKPGDWFVDSGKRQFIVEQEIFRQTYTKVQGTTSTKSED